MEPVFRMLEIVAGAAVRATGTRITYRGVENIPVAGGAVIAINHTGYLDFLPAALAAKSRGRRLRFMIKAEMQEVPAVDFLIRHTKTIPVDRRAGGDAYAVAVARLREGEIVAVYPEATISRSFELKEFKSGAARMALEARVPIVPLVVWGAHRLWTKDHPRNLGHEKIPVTVAAGPPLPPTGTATELLGRLRTGMTELLHSVQQTYDHPKGAHWVPHRLGGGAPTMEEARVREDAERAQRARNEPENP
ncbi:MAG: 1-acyl-sn-glycerol-3-phosphate acyltransferase [Actinomycetota bacterium]|nr:1-acyl-sn-glycerol-3-phosphate acyltransferase [Actinomycetota bacterium]